MPLQKLTRSQRRAAADHVTAGDLCDLLDEVAPDADGNIYITIPFGRHCDAEIRIAPRDQAKVLSVLADVALAERFVRQVSKIGNGVFGPSGLPRCPHVGGWIYPPANALRHGLHVCINVNPANGSWDWRGRGGWKSGLVKWLRAKAQATTGDLSAKLLEFAKRVSAMEVGADG